MTDMTPDGPPRSTPTWFVDELDYAGRENLDAGHVARYDAKEDASAASEVALLKHLGLTRESRSWSSARARASSPSTSRQHAPK
jgi:hypothetical protein